MGRELTFDMSGGFQRAQPAGNRPLDGRVRRRATIVHLQMRHGSAMTTKAIKAANRTTAPKKMYAIPRPTLFTTLLAVDSASEPVSGIGLSVCVNNRNSPGARSTGFHELPSPNTAWQLQHSSTCVDFNWAEQFGQNDIATPSVEGKRRTTAARLLRRRPNVARR